MAKFGIVLKDPVLHTGKARVYEGDDMLAAVTKAKDENMGATLLSAKLLTTKEEIEKWQNPNQQ